MALWVLGVSFLGFGLRSKRVKSGFINFVGFFFGFLLQWTPKQDWFYFFIYEKD